MARIVFGWEQGSNYGHVSSFVGVARELVSRGHELVLVLRDPGSVASFADDIPHTLLPAPVALNPLAGLAPRQRPQSFSQTLHTVGIRKPEAMRHRLVAWRTLLGLVEPDLVIAGAAPSLLMALRGSGLPTVTYESAWGHPADVHPQPLFPGEAGDPLRVDREVLRQIAAACPDQPPLERVSDLWRVDASLVRAFSELDFRADQRRHVTYVGNSFTLDRGEAHPWPEGDLPRVFAYLRFGPDFAQYIRALVVTKCRSIVVCPDLPDDFPMPPPEAKITLTRQPARLDRMREQADLAITSSPTGTGAAFLLAGVPVVFRPQNAEQGLAADRVQALGAGVNARGQGSALARILKRLLRKGSHHEVARAFARKYATFGPQTTGRLTADVVDRLLAER